MFKTLRQKENIKFFARLQDFNFNLLTSLSHSDRIHVYLYSYKQNSIRAEFSMFTL